VVLAVVSRKRSALLETAGRRERERVREGEREGVCVETVRVSEGKRERVRGRVLCVDRERQTERQSG